MATKENKKKSVEETLYPLVTDDPPTDVTALLDFAPSVAAVNFPRTFVTSQSDSSSWQIYDNAPSDLKKVQNTWLLLSIGLFAQLAWAFFFIFTS